MKKNDKGDTKPNYLEKYRSPRICDAPNFEFYVDNYDKDKSPEIRNRSTVEWLKRRHSTTCRMLYLKSRRSRRKESLAQDVFRMVDVDQSGTIDLGMILNTSELS